VLRAAAGKKLGTRGGGIFYYLSLYRVASCNITQQLIKNKLTL